MNSGGNWMCGGVSHNSIQFVNYTITYPMKPRQHRWNADHHHQRISHGPSSNSLENDFLVYFRTIYYNVLFFSSHPISFSAIPGWWTCTALAPSHTSSHHNSITQKRNIQSNWIELLAMIIGNSSLASIPRDGKKTRSGWRWWWWWWGIKSIYNAEDGIDMRAMAMVYLLSTIIFVWNILNYSFR